MRDDQRRPIRAAFFFAIPVRFACRLGYNAAMIRSMFSSLRSALSVAAAATLAACGADASSWPQPDPATLADGPGKDEITYGEALIRQTYALIGPEVADPAMRYAGNNLACGSCHLDGGRQRYALSFIGAYDAYPRNMARENEVRTLTQRINGCLERSMNGRALPDGSREMRAMLAYIRFLSDAAPKDLDGRATPQLALLDRAADPTKGEAVYAANCAVCHGDDGQGIRRGVAGDADGYLYPPLWGPDSFNSGAGMHRVIMSARYIHANMPFGATFESPLISAEDAWDVAAFVNSQERPQKAGLDRDFPDRSRKPVDAPFPPYADDFPAEQHKYGPFAPMMKKEQAGK